MNILKFVIISTVVSVNLVSCLDHEKVSLTFVIDDTGSMSDDIVQVMNGANDIFDTVMNSEKSDIENFVLVTFNDPTTALRAKTKNRHMFKNTLSSINVYGGDDCPEYAMSGIKKALEESLPGSYLYVFTDASAKDHEKYDEVENMALQRRSQIVFVLTGMCSGPKDKAYQVYHKLANTTGGEVFHLEKHEINKILSYVKTVIEAPSTLLTSKSFPPGYGHKLNYTTDVKTKDQLITVTGEEPALVATGPDGKKSTHEVVVDTDNIKILKITDAKPGVHTVEVGSKSNTTVKVVAKSEVRFNFGFSTFVPSTFNDVTTRPVPDTKSYISIKITEGDLEMRTVKILDMGGKTIDEITLNILDLDEKLYVTNATELPNTLFRIAVTGFDFASGATITRIASSPVEPQRVTGPATANKAPIVTTDKDGVNVIYDNSLQLICKVSAFPKPDINWINEEGITLEATVSIFDLPYDYISILNIEHAITNNTYHCKAKNDLGEDAKPIAVEVTRKRYIEISEKPKDTVIEYNRPGELYCKVDSYPDAEITWYKDGHVLSLLNSTIELKDNSSVLKINNMQPDDVGIYLCEVRNEVGRKLLQAKLDITGAEPPLIDKNTTSVHVKQHSDVVINCKLMEGTPRPSIVWYKRNLDDEETEISDTRDQEIITLRNVQKYDKGAIICEVQNDFGQDNHEIELIVDYPPLIKSALRYVQVKGGDDVLLSCDADGEPTPDVMWDKNGTPMVFEENTMYKNFALQITSATVEDIGNYTCLVINSVGTAHKTIFVDVTVPVKIISPEPKILRVKVGSKLLLPCRAEGFPKPHIKWTYKGFKSSYFKVIKNHLSSNESTFSLVNRIQIDEEGYYTCKASNPGSLDSVTYEIHVLAPPIIENTYKEKIFKAVEGDLALRINCKASGNPKPNIRWRKDGFYVVLGDSYDIDTNGTLLIKNIKQDASGDYVCEAQNDLGIKTERYEVEVRKSPPVRFSTATVWIEYGSTSTIECKVPHKLTDRLRWYKYNQLIKEGEFTITNAKPSDSGTYTCRVSDFFNSKSDSVNLLVGYKPRFMTREKENIELTPGNPNFLLNCEARGYPKPEITWWFNKAKLNSSEMVHSIGYSVHNRGTYHCKVQNQFGSITRTFIVSTRDCVIELNKMKSHLQPLMLSKTMNWPTYQTDDGHMIIPKDDYVFLFCPEKLKQFPQPYVKAYCDGGSKFTINKALHTYSDIECTEPYNYIVKSAGERCLPYGNTEKLKVVFETLHRTVEVYEVCFNHAKKIPIYTKHYMPRTSMGADVEEKWNNDDVFKNADFDSMYKCDNQVSSISLTLRKWFHKDDKCCFRKRQLVNQKDVVPGVAQGAVFSYLNVVPQWSTCNINNWDEIENQVRLLSQSTYSDLLVWSGASVGLTLKTPYKRHSDIYITDGRRHRQPIPKYLWKVIQEPTSGSSLAIIQVNVPDLKWYDVRQHIRCRNICDHIEWMTSSHWNDVDRGFVYCCSLNEFEEAFGLRSVFEPHYKVLNRVDSYAALT